MIWTQISNTNMEQFYASHDLKTLIKACVGYFL